MRTRRIAAIAAVFAALTLTGCASKVLLVAVPNSAPSPSPTATTACPYSGTEEVDIPGCAMYDGEFSMQQNGRYKIRMAVTPKNQAILNDALVPVRAALLEVATPIPTPGQVKDTLKSEGLSFVEVASNAATEVAFWAAKGTAGCLFGEITAANGLTIESGGFVADGGCHALSGH